MTAGLVGFTEVSIITGCPKVITIVFLFILLLQQSRNYRWLHQHETVWCCVITQKAGNVDVLYGSAF